MPPLRCPSKCRASKPGRVSTNDQEPSAPEVDLTPAEAYDAPRRRSEGLGGPKESASSRNRRTIGRAARSRNDRADLRGYEQIGRRRDHLKVFANADVAETWFEENEPAGVAFECDVLETK